MVGVDDNEEYITTFQKLVRLLNLKNESIEPVFARDGIAGFKDSSVDTVIMQEAASHIPSNVFRDILQDVYRVLRTGGCVFLEDDNNKAQLPFLQEKRRRKKLRLIAESGRVSDYPQLGLEESYRTSRERIIRGHFPTLSEKEIKMYAKKTQGMEKREVLDSVHQSIAGNKIRNKAPYQFTDPNSGHVFEMEINPFKVKKLLREKGFKSRLVPPNLSIVVKQSDTWFLRVLKIILQKTIKHPKVFFYPIVLFFDNNIRILAKKQITYRSTVEK